MESVTSLGKHAQLGPVRREMAKRKKAPPKPEAYEHTESTSPMRPVVGVQAQFKKKLPPTTYRYDSSLAPELVWDESATRADVETLIAQVLHGDSLDGGKAAGNSGTSFDIEFTVGQSKPQPTNSSTPLTSCSRTSMTRSR